MDDVERIWPDEALQWLYSRALNLDQLVLNASDSIDIKASVLVAVFALLMAVALEMFHARAISYQKFMIDIAIVTISVSGALTLFSLWPRNYETDAFPEEIQEWMHKLRRNRAHEPSDSQINFSREILDLYIEDLNARIKINFGINQFRMKFLKLAFLGLVFSVLLLMLVGLI